MSGRERSRKNHVEVDGEAEVPVDVISFQQERVNDLLRILRVSEIELDIKQSAMRSDDSSV